MVTLDCEQGQAYSDELEDAYLDLFSIIEEIVSDWQEGRMTSDISYYWNYELLPVLNSAIKFEEQTLRILVTWLVDGIQIKGKPLKEVYPEAKEWMLKNFNKNGETLVDKLAFNRMPVILEEWPYADWLDFENCVKTYEADCKDVEDVDSCLDDIYQWTCDNYDTYNDDFFECSRNDNCDGMNAWSEAHTDDSYWQPISDEEVEEPRDTGSVITLSFDEIAVNAWIE